MPHVFSPENDLIDLGDELDLGEAEQSFCFAGCGTPVDNAGDCCSNHCERLVSPAADQAATDMYG
jgi:hypothetical protein